MAAQPHFTGLQKVRTSAATKRISLNKQLLLAASVLAIAAAGEAGAGVITLPSAAPPDGFASPPTPPSGELELAVYDDIFAGGVTDVQLVGNNADIASLQITSFSSGIITANWTDLHSQGYSNWADTAKKKNGIGEFDNQFTVSGDFAVINGFIDYGDIYNSNIGIQDYSFKYGSVESNGTTVDTDTGSVYYLTPVGPEPTTLGFISLAALGLMARRRRKD